MLIKTRQGNTKQHNRKTKQQSLQEILRKARQHNNNTTDRQTKLATQNNSHKTVIFPKKMLPRVGLEPTTISFPGNVLTN